MNAEDQKTITTAAGELADDIALVKRLREEAKTVGWKEALAKNSPEIVREFKDDVAAFRAAAPIVKAGYKTTEFWLVAGLIVANTVLVTVKGTALPWDVNATAGVLIGIYTSARALVKKG